MESLSLEVSENCGDEALGNIVGMVGMSWDGAW